ncbi:hypothetical protein ACFW4M_20370 [Streptomyces sp. NPDC058794]|uniref:hypothetical protein n=1 Tax=unclassified Streptomyces TaxID=2593676 RepID=UPI0036BE6E0E
MWPGEQPSTGGPNSHLPDPNRQPGHQQHQYAGQSPYAGQHQPSAGRQAPAAWHTPAFPGTPPPGRRPGGGRTKVVAVVAAAAVVVAAAVTGAVLLAGDDPAEPGPTASQASASAAGGPADGADGPRPTVEGWQVVTNPDLGIAFDVPASWVPKAPTWVTYVAENDDPEDKPLVAMRAPAVLEEKWCAADSDRDGWVDHVPLASAGTRGNDGARGPEEIARKDSAAWVYGAFAQPAHDKVSTGPVTSFTASSGIAGSVATSRSSGVEKRDKCDVDGKATTFVFETAGGDLVSWSFYGAADVADEVPDGTVRKILATVRYVPDKGQ